MSARARWRVWLGNGALAVGSLLLFASLAEGLARLSDLRPKTGHALVNPPWLGERWLLRRDYRERLADAGLLARYYDLYQWNRYLFFSLRPHRDLQLIDPMAPETTRERTSWSVHTNSRGFRTPEFERARTPGRLRIVVLGDSSTFGWGVAVEDAYPEQLRHLLAKRMDLDPAWVEVINLGVPGYSTFQGRVLLEGLGLTLRPDFVIWSYLSNDGAATGEADRDAFARRAGWQGAILEVLHTSAAFEALEAWIRVARWRLRPPREPDPRDPRSRNVADYREAADNVRQAVLAARRAGVPMLLLAQCVRRDAAGVLARVAELTHTPLLDATALLDSSLGRIASEVRFQAERAALAERYGDGALRERPYLLGFLPDACHPNAIGHRIVAEALAERVREQRMGSPAP